MLHVKWSVLHAKDFPWVPLRHTPSKTGQRTDQNRPKLNILAIFRFFRQKCVSAES